MIFHASWWVHPNNALTALSPAEAKAIKKKGGLCPPPAQEARPCNIGQCPGALFPYMAFWFSSSYHYLLWPLDLVLRAFLAVRTCDPCMLLKIPQNPFLHQQISGRSFRCWCCLLFDVFGYSFLSQVVIMILLVAWLFIETYRVVAREKRAMQEGFVSQNLHKERCTYAIISTFFALSYIGRFIYNRFAYGCGVEA